MNSITPGPLEGQALGKYQVLTTIGRGNMATVYLGQDPFIDRPVAIKVAFDEYVQSDENGNIRRGSRSGSLLHRHGIHPRRHDPRHVYER